MLGVAQRGTFFSRASHITGGSMQTIAMTGCASSFARVLLPLLEADPEIERIIGLDRVPAGNAFSKLTFYQQDIPGSELKELLYGCQTVIHGLDNLVGGE